MAEKKFPVEAGHIMMFARAVGDPNPIYHDDEYARTTEVGGLIAPPTFVQASAQFDPEYGLRPKIGEPWFGYHRPIRPGDVLTAETKRGRTWEKQGRRGGKLLFGESITEYRDQNGELVVTARSVGVRTEKVIEQ
jgi:acyl dehydratase